MCCSGLPLPWASFLRCSEFTYNSPFDATYHLSRTDVTFHRYILHGESDNVVIKRSKTVPFRHGCHSTIGSSNNKRWPVWAMKTYLLQSPSKQKLHHLFKFTSGDPLTRPVLTSHLRRMLQGHGLDGKLYASHSFWIGVATAANTDGLPSWLKKTLGRWTLDCYERYIRTLKEVLVSVPYEITASNN